MIDLSLVLIGIVILFTVFMISRSFFPFTACALCAAISTTWIILLVSFYSGISVDPILIGILMGGTAVGLIHLLSKKLTHFDLFKLPFLVTAITLIYMALTLTISYLAVALVLVLWAISGTVFAGRNNATFAAFGKKIIECCKDW